MRILITGASGFIGRRLSRALFEAGDELVVVGRDQARAAEAVGVPHRFARWDSAAEPFPDTALDGVDGVVHLAGEPIAAGRWTPAAKARIRASRVIGTQRLAAALTARGAAAPRVLVSMSAIGYYPATSGDDAATEDAPPGTGFLADVCRDWEAAAAAAQLGGVRVVTLRLGLVVGREGGVLARLRPLFAAGVGGPLGDGRQWMSWIHADDAVALARRALADAAWHGAFNATAPVPVRNAEFSATLAAVLGRRMGPAAPKLALRLLYGEMAEALLESQRVVPRKALAAGVAFRYAALADALAAEVSAATAGDEQLTAVQWLPRPPPEVFRFFADERNLERLTPAFLGFKMLGKSAPALAAGALIDYRLTVHRVPLRWRTRIVDWAPPARFSDEQLRGPYAKWLHTHSFSAQTYGGVAGTLVSDRVLYRLPLGPLGRLAAGGVVRRDMQALFAYRRAQLAALLDGGAQASP